MSAFYCIKHTMLEGQRWDTRAWLYYGNVGQYGRIVQATLPLISPRTYLSEHWC